MKSFKEKFEILMDTVEQNLKSGTVLSVQDEAGKKMGETGRKVGIAFSFITNMTINNYMTRRRYDEAMRRALSTVGEKSHIEKAAAEFGYYDRSNFDNEVERIFGAKPAAYTSGEVEFTGMRKIEVKDLVGLQIANEDDFTDSVTEIFVIIDHRGSFSERQKELLNDRLDCQAAYGVDIDLLEIIQKHMMNYSRSRLAEACEKINMRKAEALENLQDVIEDFETELNAVTEMLDWVALTDEELDDVRKNIVEIEDRIDEIHRDVYNIVTGDMSITEIERVVENWQELEFSYKRDKDSYVDDCYYGDEYYDEENYDENFYRP